MNHLSIAFYGSYRPFHVERETIDECAQAAIKSVSDDGMKATIRRAMRKMKKRPEYAMVGLHAPCGASIQLAAYERNPWLDRLTADMPTHPRIAY